MNKKQLIISVVVVIVLVLAGVAFYYYLPSGEAGTENIQLDENNTESTNEEGNISGVEIELGGVEGVSSGPQGGIIVCAYKCGDGICQNNIVCEPGDMNCICAEDIKECPEDCSK